MTQPNILELAKQGDATAIATLLNQSLLKPRSFTAKASRKDDCLKVVLVLESAQIADQHVLVGFILAEMFSLGVKSIRKVKVYGQQANTFDPAWRQEFELEQKVKSSSSANASSQI